MECTGTEFSTEKEDHHRNKDCSINFIFEPFIIESVYCVEMWQHVVKRRVCRLLCTTNSTPAHTIYNDVILLNVLTEV